MKTETLTPLERKCIGTNIIKAATFQQLEHILPQLEKRVRSQLDVREISMIDIPTKHRMVCSEEFSLFTWLSGLYLSCCINIDDKEFELEVVVGYTHNGELIQLETIDRLVRHYKLGHIHDPKWILKTQKKIESLKEEIKKLEKIVNF